MSNLGPFWSADCWRPGRPERPNRDVADARKLLLQYRLTDLLDKQKRHRPPRERSIEETTHDPNYAGQYPRGRRAPLRAQNDFDVRRGTQLNQITPSYGIGATDATGRTWRYGNVSADIGVPGSQTQAAGRYRAGERPSRRSNRRMPPYGGKTETTRVIEPLSDFVEQESQNQPRKHNLRPRARGAARDAGRARETRRQGEMSLDKQTARGAGVTAVGSGSAANVQGALHVAGYGEQRRRKRRKAKLMAKKIELMVVHDVLKGEQVQKALAQADDALRTVDNASKFVKGFHPDGEVFDVWSKAIELLKAEQNRPVTMKGLR
jgi:hypothetical protein